MWLASRALYSLSVALWLVNGLFYLVALPLYFAAALAARASAWLLDRSIALCPPPPADGARR